MPTPRRRKIRSVRTILLTVWIILFSVIVLWQLHSTRSETSNNRQKFAAADAKLEARFKQADVNACKSVNKKIAKIILRTFSMTYEQYRVSPKQAERVFRRVLLGNAFYRDHPELIEQSVKQTLDILKETDPSTCEEAVTS